MPATIHRTVTPIKKLTIAAAASASDAVDIESAATGLVQPTGNWAYDIGFVTAYASSAYQLAENAPRAYPTFTQVRESNGDPARITNVTPDDWHRIPDSAMVGKFIKVVALDKVTGAVVAPGSALVANVCFKS